MVYMVTPTGVTFLGEDTSESNVMRLIKDNKFHNPIAFFTIIGPASAGGNIVQKIYTVNGNSSLMPVIVNASDSEIESKTSQEKDHIAVKDKEGLHVSENVSLSYYIIPGQMQSSPVLMLSLLGNVAKCFAFNRMYQHNTYQQRPSDEPGKIEILYEEAEPSIVSNRSLQRSHSTPSSLVIGRSPTGYYGDWGNNTGFVYDVNSTVSAMRSQREIGSVVINSPSMQSSFMASSADTLFRSSMGGYYSGLHNDNAGFSCFGSGAGVTGFNSKYSGYPQSSISNGNIVIVSGDDTSSSMPRSPTGYYSGLHDDNAGFSCFVSGAGVTGFNSKYSEYPQSPISTDNNMVIVFGGDTSSSIPRSLSSVNNTPVMSSSTSDTTSFSLPFPTGVGSVEPDSDLVIVSSSTERDEGSDDLPSASIASSITSTMAVALTFMTAAFKYLKREHSPIAAASTTASASPSTATSSSTLGFSASARALTRRRQTGSGDTLKVKGSNIKGVRR